VRVEVQPWSMKRDVTGWDGHVSNPLPSGLKKLKKKRRDSCFLWVENKNET